MHPIPPILYDYSGLLAADDAPAFVRQTGVAEADLAWLAPRLADARREVLADRALFESGGAVPVEKQPLDAGFHALPDRLLNQDRRLVDQIVATADRLAAEVDRVVVLGIGGSYASGHALMEALAHPYHNELVRSRRGNRPCLYFEGNNVDNDALRGLLDLLDRGRAGGVDQRWAIVVISKSGGTLETAVAFRLFFDALRQSCGNDQKRLRHLVVPITSQAGRLSELAQALGCRDIFPIPEGVGGRFSIFTAVGLLPAALLGLDIVRLLEGAAAMNERFRTAEGLENPVLAFAGVSRFMETRRGAAIRVLSTWGKRLEGVGLWYDQLLAESLGKDGQGATPLTVVNTRDLHSRGQQHQEGRRDKLITNLVVQSPSTEPLSVPRWESNQDRLNDLAGKTMPEILDAAYRGTNRAYAEDYRRTAEILLPRLDEGSLGQLFQMLMLATVVEGRLIGINPYGQPGVEAYKRNMNAILRGR